MEYSLKEILTEFTEKNVNLLYEPVAVGKYGIRKRSDIYKKELSKDYSKNKVIYKDTLIIGMGSTQIDVGVLLSDSTYSVSQAYHTYKINTKIVKSAFLAYLFKAKNYEYTRKYMIASARQGKKVNLSDMLEEKVNIPNLDIQDKIVNVIDEISNNIVKIETQFSLYEELVKTKFVELFGDPVKNSKGYPVEKLENLGLLKRGKSKHRPRNAPELLGGPYPLIQTGDVSNADTYILQYYNTYSELGLKQSKLWKKGTLCITIAANIAETAILGFDACFPDSVVGFIPEGKVTTLYIHNWFKFLQPILEENAPSVAQKNLNVETLGQTDVIVPPIEMQNEFELFLKKIEQIKLKSSNQMQFFNELLNKKMYEYFK